MWKPTHEYTVSPNPSPKISSFSHVAWNGRSVPRCKPGILNSLISNKTLSFQLAVAINCLLVFRTVLVELHFGDLANKRECSFKFTEQHPTQRIQAQQGKRLGDWSKSYPSISYCLFAYTRFAMDSGHFGPCSRLQWGPTRISAHPKATRKRIIWRKKCGFPRDFPWQHP